MKALFALALVTVVLLAGCSSTPVGPTELQKNADGKYEIHLTAANTFSPQTGKVPVGATVKWVNDGGFHDVTANDHTFSSDDSGSKLQAGNTYEHTFSVAGTYEYNCSIHESTGMKGTLTVA